MRRYKIRGMSGADIPRILEIERASFVTPWTEWMFESQIDLKDIAINLVLEIEGIIAGYAAAWVARYEIHLLSIAVAPEERKKGYGRSLLETVTEKGVKMGGRSIVLEVRESNITAIRFYRNLDFRVIGMRSSYYTDTGENAVIMQRRLVCGGSGFEGG